MNEKASTPTARDRLGRSPGPVRVAANYAAWEIDPADFCKTWPALQKLQFFARTLTVAGTIFEVSRL
ncbi:MAG: hypothetical protein M1522_08425 [Actinobacteria bacterium]|nr:hypothetical protein [Actinomycetota bacterium]